MAHDVLKIFLRLFNDIFSIVYFFDTMENREISKKKRVCGYLLLLGMIITIWPENFWPYLKIELVAVRFMIRMFYTMSFLMLLKKGSVKRKLYFALVLSIVYTNFTNIFMASPFIEFRTEKVAFFENPLVNVTFVHFVQWCILYFELYLVRRECEFGRKMEKSRFFVTIYLFIAVFIGYVKQSAKIRYNLQTQFEVMSETTLYYYVINVLVLVAVIMLERFAKTEEKRKNLEYMVSLQSYQYQALMERGRLEQQIYCLQHDMKNHLLAIKTMAGDNQKIEEYIEGLQGELEKGGHLIETGNALVDGLMSEKLRQAGESHIRVNASIDLRGAEYIRDVDLCAVISNAMDNAIEASLLVKDLEKRRIHIKAGMSGEFLVFRFMNYFENELKSDGERLLTGKKDKKLHGLGLMSIRHALEKYGGDCTTEVDENHYFILKVLIPIGKKS